MLCGPWQSPRHFDALSGRATQSARWLLPLIRRAYSGNVSAASTSSGKAAATPRQPQQRFATARSIALQQLVRIEQEGAFSNLLSEDSQDTDSSRGVRDPTAGLLMAKKATALVAGVTRWRLYLDWLMEMIATGPTKRTRPHVRQVLRLGAYELVILKEPPYVANEYINLLKDIRKKEAANFVNAMLRKVTRAIEAGQLPEPVEGAGDASTPLTAVQALSIRHSHPLWMVKRWADHFSPEDLTALLEANNRKPQYAVRAAGGDTAALQTELQDAGIEAVASLFLPGDFLQVEGMQQLLMGPWLRNGRCSVQDEAAGLVVALLDPQPGEAILDCCAAPGGKALFAASRMRGLGSLLALDINEARLDLVRNTALLQGLTHMIRTQATSLQDYLAGRGTVDVTGSPAVQLFDRVLLDAPCSGTGVLGKRADLRWRRTPEQLLELVQLQVTLLDAAAQLVKPGGVLVYSTCSIEPDENEQQILAFLQRWPNFALQQPEHLSPSVLSTQGFLKMLPHVHGTDGAFGASLRRHAE
ncbi:hypothetical protein WJX73_007491 [Symbiochloris irregularis]|uniref:16S rRNA (cytosine(967)-C(5))-methyltransferase n=1 Tax=Symbiochloris irregularis TaxID=706552 RepID=A0AAW1PRZ6_9CHLO